MSYLDSVIATIKPVVHKLYFVFTSSTMALAECEGEAEATCFYVWVDQVDTPEPCSRASLFKIQWTGTCSLSLFFTPQLAIITSQINLIGYGATAQSCSLQM